MPADLKQIKDKISSIAIFGVVIAQYFGANSQLYSMGFNHVPLMQLVFIALIFAISFIRGERAFYESIMWLLIVIFVLLSHFLINIYLLGGGEIRFENHILEYAYHILLFFVFLAFNKLLDESALGATFNAIKVLFWLLSAELILYLVFRYFFGGGAEFFESAERRFSGVFMKQNAIVSIIASIIFYLYAFKESGSGNNIMKWAVLLFSLTMIMFAAERSAMLGFILGYLYLLYKNKTKQESTKVALIKIGSMFIVLVIVFSLAILLLRDNGASKELLEYTRPFILRIFFSYISILAMLDISPLGLGQYFDYASLINFSQYRGEISLFAKIVGSILGSSEEYYYSMWVNESEHIINSHNTFVNFFIFYGIFALAFFGLFVIFMVLKIMKLKAVELNALTDKEYLFSVLLLNIPVLFSLAFDKYMIFFVIFLALYLSRNRSHCHGQ